MNRQTLKKLKLPDAPGVYFFVAKDKQILYIGRATSLRDRVKSYFAYDVIHTRGPIIVDMVTEAKEIEYLQTDSVLEAVIAEANLIKKHQPRANIDEKDDKSFNYVVITKEDFPQVLLVRGKDLEEDRFKGHLLSVFGPYTQGGILKEGMKIVRRIFPWRDNKCIPYPEQLKKFERKPLARSAFRPFRCFNRQIGLCPGVCTGEISKTDYRKTVRSLQLFFEGKKNTLLKTLEKEMKTYAKVQEFEKAGEIKQKLFALTHIQDVSLIKAETMEENLPRREAVGAPTKASEPTLFRIEAYDVAHLGGKNVGGVMVVLEGREIKKSDYRLFKIRTARPSDDVGALREVLERRLRHPEWIYPNVIAVDGGVAQKNLAEKVLKEANFDIAVVAVEKNERHRPERLLGDETIIKNYKKEILLLNSEAHRFVIKYHRKMRQKSFL